MSIDNVRPRYFFCAFCSARFKDRLSLDIHVNHHDRPSVYDHAAERTTTITVDPAIARYVLAALRREQHPPHPQAHEDAIAHLSSRLKGS